MTPIRFARACLTALVPVIFALGCSDNPTAPPQVGDDSRMMLSASVVGTPIATLAVTITASDITTPIVTNLTVSSGVATGTLKMPPGSARTITVRAYDNTGEVTHEGSKVVDAKPGNGNPAVSIPMVAKSGHVDITVQIGPVSIVLSPSPLNLVVGQNGTITATITSSGGEAITDSPDWGTTNPAIATVNGSGVVTGVIPGTVSIVASYGGVAAIATVTVTSVPTFSLTVARAGAGAGVVTSSPAGISCGVACLANFANNTMVNLTAAPQSGSTFVGWSGACTGTGSCVVTMNQARNVTATFSLVTTPSSEVDFCNVQFPSNLTVSSFSTMPPIYGRLFHAGVTEAAGPSSSVMAQLGVGPRFSDPRAISGWSFTNSFHNAQIGSDDEYVTYLPSNPGPGSYSYVYRFSLNGGASWSYCDLDGAGNNAGLTFSLGSMGMLTVNIF